MRAKRLKPCQKRIIIQVARQQTLSSRCNPGGHQIMMSEELEAVLREVILVLYGEAREGDPSYWDIADELSDVILKLRGEGEE